MRIFAYRITLFLCFVTLFFSLYTTALAKEESERWTGVDELVIERFAKEHGRETREPLINTDQGDLLLFLFLVAGAIGGFVVGYYWRTLTEYRSQKTEDIKQSIEVRL